ncbi:MAG: ribosome recycling factor [candidate division WS1 bacterium]|nr:ribosome recycling factor [candidate division WS1 bacterium]
MKQTIEAVRSEFAGVRTGRATPTLLDRVRVSYYGTDVPINQVANISIPESRLIVIAPWDKTTIPAIEKAILTSDLNLTPMSDGQVVRITIPALTEERRQELGKVVQRMAEDGRIAVRNIRRDANNALEQMEKKSEVSEDEMHRGKQQVQEVTDDYVSQIDELAQAKVDEIMEI